LTSGALRGGSREQADGGSEATLGGWLPPVHRREFWAIQALVLLVAVVHSWIEAEHLLGDHSPLYLLPTTLYLVPCIYAAVVFGMRGAALTALWAALLVVLNLLLWHDGLERVGELAQVAWIGVAAVFVGSRVDRERAARQQAEGRESARRTSEDRYKAIVDNVEEPILLLDDTGRVVEANRSAAALLDRRVSDLRGQPLPGAVGSQIMMGLDARSFGGATVDPMRLGQPPRWFELVTLDTKEPDGASVVQILLRDVTERYEREQGLESVAREALIAREEEQQRIARELHDGPVQSLVQLMRALDSLASEVPEPQRGWVVKARAQAEGVGDELRRFSRDLRPSVLDDLGISAAVRSEAESLGRRAGMLVHVQVSGKTRRLEEDTELALLRITQEAVRNIERHSGASEVTIGLQFSRSRVRLNIADDGKGLDPIPTASELLAQNHLGLVGMRERARLVRGELRASSPASGGLTIEVDIPVGELPHR
jgi:signal transduction histidine kinase